MNHASVRIVVDPRAKHPYGVAHRLQYFAHNAGVRLVLLSTEKHRVEYGITK